MGLYKFSETLENEIENISKNPKRYHEELAAIVAAVQGVLFEVGTATAIGFDGDFEGYYLLPSITYWDKVWSDCFSKTVQKKYRIVLIL